MNFLREYKARLVGRDEARITYQTKHVHQIARL